MMVQVQWDDDAQTIIRWDFEGVWTWEAFFAAAARSVALRKTATHEQPVSIILNIQGTAPRLGGALNATHHAITLNENGRGVIVVVGTHKLTQRLAKMFSEAYADLDTPILTVQSLDDAYDAIREHVETQR